MPSRAASMLVLGTLLAPCSARAAVALVTDPARFEADATSFGFEDLTPGDTLSTLSADSFTVEFDGNAGSFPVVAYADVSGALAASAIAAGLGATALRVDAGANQEIRFDPLVTRVGIYFGSSGSLLTNVTAFRDGVVQFTTQVSGDADTVKFAGVKATDGIDRIVISGDIADADPVLIDRLIFQQHLPVIYHFRGVVDEVTGDGSLIGGKVTSGASFSVSAVATPEADNYSGVSFAAAYPQPTDMAYTLTLGGRTYTTRGYILHMENDTPGDRFSLGVQSGGPLHQITPSPPLQPDLTFGGYVVLDSSSASSNIFTSVAVPVATPDVGLFDDVNRVLLAGYLPSGGPVITIEGRLLDQDPVLAVINTDDSGLGSLRQAILDANAKPGADTIVFDIPYDACGASGVCRIEPLSDLPAITEAVTLDATTQPRFGTIPGNVCATALAPSYLRIEVVHPLGQTVFSIDPASSAPVVVRGFALASGGNDIAIAGPGAHRIECNHLHVTGPGNALLFPGVREGVGVAIAASAQGAVVGTDWNGIADEGERNVIAGCDVGIAVGSLAGNVVAGNRIGLASLGNDVGVQLADAQSLVLRDNVFTGNATAIEVAGASTFGSGSQRNCVAGNTTGLAHGGSEALSFGNNWWGDASGPSGDGPGTGDSISVTGVGSLDATPFQLEGCQPVPEPDAVASSAFALLSFVGLRRIRTGGDACRARD